MGEDEEPGPLETNESRAAQGQGRAVQFPESRGLQRHTAAGAVASEDGPEDGARDPRCGLRSVQGQQDSLTKTIQDIENSPGDASSKQMQKMMQLLPKVQQLMALALTEHGFKADELMSVVMKIQACAADDPTIAADTMKLMKAAQGDISGLV